MMTTTNTFELISDLHKDARGFRPSGEWLEHFAALPADEKQGVWDDLCAELAQDDFLTRERHATAIARLTARIEQIRATVRGATVQDALRFLHDAHDTHGDAGYLEYQLGVPYGHLSTL